VRILVTGVTGQVGGALIRRLQGLGTIIPADRATLDLAQPDRIAQALEQLAPEIILNPAAYTAVEKAEDEPNVAMVANGTAPGVIARWAAKNDVPLIHFSADYVFNGAGERPWREDDATGPLNAYGKSKLVGENEVRAAGGSFLIARVCWVYAASGTNFLRTIARLARERAELRIVADQFGAPTSAALIADAVARMIEGGIADLRSRMARADGCVHLAASGETSWHLFATAIVTGLRARGVKLAVERVVPIRTDEYPAKARRPLNSRLSMERLHQVFGITPPHWEAALAAELDVLAREMVRDEAPARGAASA
jgi:dTDP-4-dehydrorhamnose reductase